MSALWATEAGTNDDDVRNGSGYIRDLLNPLVGRQITVQYCVIYWPQCVVQILFSDNFLTQVFAYLTYHLDVRWRPSIALIIPEISALPDVLAHVGVSAIETVAPRTQGRGIVLRIGAALFLWHNVVDFCCPLQMAQTALEMCAPLHLLFGLFAECHNKQLSHVGLAYAMPFLTDYAGILDCAGNRGYYEMVLRIVGTADH